MKKLYILYFILALTVNYTLAQSRFPLKPNSKWSMFLKDSNWNCSPEEQDEYYNFYIQGDTVIYTTQYFKLFKSGVAYYDVRFTYEHIYMGAIRDFDNKFFFLDKDASNEILLYDFTKNIDDTIYTGINQQFSKIYKIDTLNDGRKAFICRTIFQGGGKCTNGYVIEGIGGIGGLLYDMPCEHPGLREHFLICYSEGDSTLFTSYLTNCPCKYSENDTLTSVSNSLVNAYNTIVYPNPSNGLINLILEEKNDFEYNIVELSGKSVVRGKVKKEESQLDLRTFKKGIYFLKINGHGRSISQKIVIQ